MTDLRLILAVEADQLPNETGFARIEELGVITALEDAGPWFGPRATLEEFDAYRQIIPYIIVVQGGRIVSYTRTPSGGESRLHGKVSFGAGGHVDLKDAVVYAGKIDLEATIEEAASRELHEELGLDSAGVTIVGLLTDLTNEVGRVHQGVVAVYKLDEGEDIHVTEDELGNVEWKTIDELVADRDRMENWSQIMLPHLAGLVS